MHLIRFKLSPGSYAPALALSSDLGSDVNLPSTNFRPVVFSIILNEHVLQSTREMTYKTKQVRNKIVSGSAR